MFRANLLAGVASGAFFIINYVLFVRGHLYSFNRAVLSAEGTSYTLVIYDVPDELPAFSSRTTLLKVSFVFGSEVF